MNIYTKGCLSFLLVIVCVGCRSKDDQQDIPMFLQNPEYTEFQWLLIHQGQLLLIEQGDYFWPAFQTDNAVLESMPPQIHIARYFDKQPQTKAVNLITSPPSVRSDGFKAQLWNGEMWQPVADFRLAGINYEVKENRQATWQSVSHEQIRFQRK